MLLSEQIVMKIIDIICDIYTVFLKCFKNIFNPITASGTFYVRKCPCLTHWSLGDVYRVGDPLIVLKHISLTDKLPMWVSVQDLRCHQAASDYLNQCLPSLMMPYGLCHCWGPMNQHRYIVLLIVEEEGLVGSCIIFSMKTWLLLLLHVPV